MRKFEPVKRLESEIGGEHWEEWKPRRSTAKSAGYDMKAVEDREIPSLFQVAIGALKSLMKFNIREAKEAMKPVLVPTGIKAAMESDEALFLYNRSSNPIKRMLSLGNAVGICDSDYFSNPDNDGEIMFQFWNFGLAPVTIKKGERIGQAVFQKYLITNDDDADGERVGGHGSTGV
jgi:dUTP pyrophosphatase